MLSRPEVQRFWRRHRRMRTLPVRKVEAVGRAALVARFESVLDGAWLDLVSSRDTLAVLRVDGDVGNGRDDCCSPHSVDATSRSFG